MSGPQKPRPRSEWAGPPGAESLDRAIRQAAAQGLGETAIAARCCVSLQRVRRTLQVAPAPVAQAAAHRPAARPGPQPAAPEGDAAAALARLADFAGWVDPAVSLAGVAPAVLAGLVAAGSVEVWRGRVRAVPAVASAPPAAVAA